MIDEEGGDVSRLKSILNNKSFSQKYIGQLFEAYPLIGASIYKIYINNLSVILKNLGININTVPVLDKLHNLTHTFLKSRIYSSKVSTIQKLSKICIESYTKNKIFNVIKHIPGHGLSKSDSQKTAVVNKNLRCC